MDHCRDQGQKYCLTWWIVVPVYKILKIGRHIGFGRKISCFFLKMQLEMWMLGSKGLEFKGEFLARCIDLGIMF